MSIATAATRAAERRRQPKGVHIGGQFAAETRDESDVSLLNRPEADEPTGEPEAPLTLAGTSRVYDMQRRYRLREAVTRPPVIEPDDTVAVAVKKWAKYVSGNSALDPQAYADAHRWTPAAPDVEASARATMGGRAAGDATCWDSSEQEGAAAVTFLDPRLSAKEGTWRSRWDRSKSWSVVSLPTEQVAEDLTADLREFVAASGGDPDDIDGRLVRRMVGLTAAQAKVDGMRQNLLGASALMGQTIYGTRDPGLPSRDVDLAHQMEARAEWRSSLRQLCNDERALREAFGAVDPSHDGEKTIYAPNQYPHEVSFAQVLASARAVRRETVTHTAAALMLVDRLGVADDMYLTAARRAEHGHSATVWEDKKHIPASHVAAAAASTFARDGMGHVEIDESVDLDDLHKVEGEWAVLSRRVPHTKPPARMAFRLTGRHQAAGVYSPVSDSIAVDPRHPSSTWHEYVHHLDHTSGGQQMSLSDDFRPILRRAQKAVLDDPRFAATGRSTDYWRTPTEVFSRSAELWLAWSGVRTSLNGDSGKYDGNPAYETLYPMREQIMGYFDSRFGTMTQA